MASCASGGSADDGTGKQYVLIFWTSFILTVSSTPRCTARFFLLVYKSSSDEAGIQHKVK